MNKNMGLNKNRTRIGLGLSSILLMLAVGSVALTQETKPAQPAPPDLALLKKHVGYLASDALEGRKTGAKGANLAAEYISKQFSSYGLACPTPDRVCRHTSGKGNDYYKEFPYIASVDLGRSNSLLLTQNGKELTAQLRGEWTPIGYSSNGNTGGKVQPIFVGYGITNAEQKYDDYAELDAKGKLVIAFAGTPDGDNPHGPFGRFSDSRWKAVAAKEHGAKALAVIVNDEKFKEDRLARLSYDQMAGEAGLPVIAISRQLAARLMGLSETAQLAAIQKAPDKRVEAEQKLAGFTLNLSVEIKRKTVPGYNVMGIIEGTDPKLKSEYLIFGAHYDHLGFGGESSRAPEANEIHHGADDNASGVAALLELARIFAANRAQLRRSVAFIAFSGEESGLIGSHHYVNNPFIPNARTATMLNLDMVGRLKDNKLTVGGVGTATGFRKLVESSNDALDPGQRFTLQLSEDGFGPSDHSSFYARQIPVLFFFTGTHEDYHKPSDTAEKINYEGTSRIVAYAAGLARQIDQLDVRPTYTLAQSSGSGGMRASGFRVYLGTIPSYAESNDGLSLDGVRDDSPAVKAGLKAGDKIVRLAGREIKNVYDYTYALGEMKPDQEYEIEVVRGGEKLKMTIVPGTRK